MAILDWGHNGLPISSAVSIVFNGEFKQNKHFIAFLIILLHVHVLGAFLSIHPLWMWFCADGFSQR